MAPFWRGSNLRAKAMELTAELQSETTPGFRFRVVAHRNRSLELLVWPEGGLDNFVFDARTDDEISRATDELRRIVGLYRSGQRPPFGTS